MVTRRREEVATDLRSLNAVKEKKSLPPLSARDQKILDALTEGKRDAEIAKEFNLSRERIGQIKNTPAALAYMATRSTTARGRNYAIVQEMITRRLQMIVECGDMVELDLLVKLHNALAPKHEHDPSAYEFLHGEAQRIADEYNLTGDRRAAFLSLVRENAA